jgi:hypothetical protein
VLTSSLAHVSGKTRVTRIQFGSWHEQELAPALAFFVMLTGAYLLLRHAQSKKMGDG